MYQDNKKDKEELTGYSSVISDALKKKGILPEDLSQIKPQLKPKLITEMSQVKKN
jgi:hypothetical protein